MSKLEKLKAATSLHDVAELLGYKPKALAYVLYKKSPESKYQTFEIPKRRGGMRVIRAPYAELMGLQRRLAEYLQGCIAEINSQRKVHTVLSHGFRPKFSIITNAAVHRRRRYVLNLDLHDFFGTINFGRVRGFFITNNHFQLNKDVATILAQIACFDNSLPQGSPCSPVVSNLIGHLLDIRLVELANRNGCSYSRYADDITFSANKKEFPEKIAKAVPGDSHSWNLGGSLEKLIAKAGFTVNHAKTRMQYRTSSQEVTGLIVNAKVNTRPAYRRVARAMVHRLLTQGSFFTKHVSVDVEGKSITEDRPGSIEQLNGILSFIDSVTVHNRTRERPPSEQRKDLGPPAQPNMEEVQYRRFLFFKHFFASQLPIIVCEGKTDNIYIQCALRRLVADFPKLGELDEKGRVKQKLAFFRRTKTTDRMLGMSGGTAQLVDFMKDYQAEARRLKVPLQFPPVIVLVDNDDGAKSIYGYLKNALKLKSPPDAKLPYFHVAKNLYVVPTPLTADGKGTMIEDFFPGSVLDTKLNGKSFNPQNEGLDLKKEYGKSHFALHVVKKNEATIDFSGFKPILKRIEEAIDHHATRCSVTGF
jgi:retron-type reverse transcriptase